MKVCHEQPTLHTHLPRDATGQKCATLTVRIKHLLKEKDAVLVAHYYVGEDLQRQV